jgi:hypothetical protein
MTCPLSKPKLLLSKPEELWVKTFIICQMQWFTSIIPATQEAEVGRMVVFKASLGKKVNDTPSQPINNLDVWHTLVIPAMLEAW